MEFKKPLKKDNPSLDLIRDEEGSSMVEFALVLPLLIVLTVGSIYLSIGFTQKSLMNGLAFMETRAASVRQQHSYIAEHAVRNYVKNTEGNQKWIEQTKSEIKVDQTSKDLTVIVSKDAMNTEILSNTLNIIGGNKPDGKAEIRKLKTSMILPIEYITLAGRSDRPITSTTVRYGSQIMGTDTIKDKLLGGLAEPVKDLLLKAFPKDLIDTKEDHPEESNKTKVLDGILSTDYTRNMARINGRYDYWGMNIGNNHDSEVPETLTIKDVHKINSLGFMRVTADHIRVIETGTDLASVALTLSGFGPGIQSALAPVQSVGKVLLPKVAEFGDKIANTAETNNSLLFKRSALGPD